VEENKDKEKKEEEPAAPVTPVTPVTPVAHQPPTVQEEIASAVALDVVL